MIGMTCRDVEGFLDRYLEGSLASWPRILFRLHLAVCRECRSYIRKYQIAQELTTSVAKQELADTEVPEDLIKAILAARLAEAQEPDK